jgi:hypothetical protein
MELLAELRIGANDPFPVLTASVGRSCSLPGVSVIVPADVEIDTREARPNAVTQRDLGGRVAR